MGFLGGKLSNSDSCSVFSIDHARESVLDIEGATALTRRLSEQAMTEGDSSLLACSVLSLQACTRLKADHGRGDWTYLPPLFTDVQSLCVTHNFDDSMYAYLHVAKVVLEVCLEV